MNVYQVHTLRFTKKIVLLSAAFIFCLFSTYGQTAEEKNLVPNPSFETHRSRSGDLKNALPWVGIGTVDYYMKPEKRDTSRYKGARTGTAYAGLRFQRDYKEYMYVPLTDKLERNKTYHFKMYVRLLDYNNVTVTVKQLGVYFSDFAFNPKMSFDKESMIDSSYKKGISGTLDWIPIQGDYVAHGGEKYIIIGNFREKMKDDFVKKNPLNLFEFAEAYYYIDDVSLYRKIMPEDTASEPPQVFPDKFVVNQVVDVKNIQFEKDGTRILLVSQRVLDNVILMLNNHPFMELQINLTDNTSVNSRAKAIHRYLTDHGAINPMVHNGIQAPSGDTTGTKLQLIITKP
ncbi:MAG TPA: hypothetical protein VLB84_18705 [Bacteroidia bacterium]|nr:hypothetical protein [Bacteroidia bacterium]